MAYAPIALTMPQYEDYANWYLKAYTAGTTTPLSMATDSGGGTLLAKSALDSTGFPTTNGTTRFTPYINGAYDLWMFPTSAEADADDTTNAIQMADNVNADPSAAVTVTTTRFYATISAAMADYANISNGDAFIIQGYNAVGDGGGGEFKKNTSGDKADHNGVTIFDPAITYPSDWTNRTQVTAWFTAGTGTGYIERTRKDHLTLIMGGVLADTAAADIALANLLSVAFSIGAFNVYDYSGGNFLIEGVVPVPYGVSIHGNHTASADSLSPPKGTKFTRNADINMFTMIGTNRITNRVGHNTFSGIIFTTTNNIGASDWFSCKYADSVLLENCTFNQTEHSLTVNGHQIYAEECWDWRINNVMFKASGEVTTRTSAAIYIYNGDDDSSNDWQFFQTRFQQADGPCIKFDSSGGGNNNSYFWFDQCKFEDTTKVSPSQIQGTANRVFLHQCQFGGTAASHVEQGSTNSGWHLSQCNLYMSSTNTTSTEYIKLQGSENIVRDCHFQSPGTAVLQYINVTGADNVITGCTKDGSMAVYDTFVDGDVNTGTDRITVTSHPFVDGDICQLTTTGTLPAGLATSTNYYINSVDANTIEFYSDAALTTIINITAAAGGGTHSIKLTIPLVNRTGVNATTKIHHNPDFLTEYASTSAIPNTANNVVIAHGLAYVPSVRDITITPASLFNNGVVALVVSEVTRSIIRVTATGSAGAAITPTTAITFGWSISRVRG